MNQAVSVHLSLFVWFTYSYPTKQDNATYRSTEQQISKQTLNIISLTQSYHNTCRAYMLSTNY